MKKFVVTTIAAASLISLSAVAETSPSFDFVSLNYLHNDVSGGSAGGFDVKGNVSFYDNFFVEAEVSRVSKSGVTPITSELGLGYAFEVAPATALVATAGIAHNRVSFKNFPTAKDTGQYATFGVRSRMIHDDIELGAKVNRHWMDVSNTSYTVDGRYYIQDALSVEVGYNYVNSHAKQYNLGVAYHF